MAMAIIRFCMEKARETAVRASSSMRATNRLSMMLYSACTIMEMTIGMEVLMRRGWIGSVPIRFGGRCFAAVSAT